jgi:hypothetical protein
LVFNEEQEGDASAMAADKFEAMYEQIQWQGCHFAIPVRTEFLLAGSLRVTIQQSLCVAGARTSSVLRPIDSGHGILRDNLIR